MNFISDEDIEKSVDFLRDNADAAAEARANKIYMAEYRKSLKAILMKESERESGVIQERNAYSDERYIKHLQAMKEAVKLDAKFEFLREAAKAKQEAWKIASYNYKAIRV